MTTTAQTTPRIYVASLSDYNAGRLHGRWIDADQHADEILEEVQAMLAASSEPGAEEWAIHDYEGFGPYSLSEWESFENVAALAKGIEAHGLAYAGWAAENDPTDEDGFSDAYQGTYDSVKAFAEDWASQVGVGTIRPEVVADNWSYIDWDYLASEMRNEFSVVDLPDGRVAMFRL